jgi:hypothetical protein
MTTRCLIGVDVVFPVAAMAVIEEDETEPTTKISDITNNDKGLLKKIILIDFS